MNITKARLKEIIQEELERLVEADRPRGLGLDYDPNVRPGEQRPEAVKKRERIKELTSRIDSLSSEEMEELKYLVADL